MTYTDMGQTGAKRQSWREANPRELLRRLVERFPQADDEELFQRFDKEVRRSRADMLEAVMRYCFDNNIRNLRVRPASPQRRRSAAEQIKVMEDQITANVKKRIHEEAERLLLDTVMPNGKILRECTGGECQGMGGWLTTLGQNLKPQEQVGEKFSEEQVRSHWRRTYEGK